MAAALECLLVCLKNLVQMVDNQTLSRALLEAPHSAFALVGLVGVLMRQIRSVPAGQGGEDQGGEHESRDVGDALTGTLALVTNLAEADTEWRTAFRHVGMHGSPPLFLQSPAFHLTVIDPIQWSIRIALVHGLARVNVDVRLVRRRQRRLFHCTRLDWLPQIHPIQSVDPFSL
jgi:hypothetical protein